jgi:hypothetical protein
MTASISNIKCILLTIGLAFFFDCQGQADLSYLAINTPHSQPSLPARMDMNRPVYVSMMDTMKTVFVAEMSIPDDVPALMEEHLKFKQRLSAKLKYLYQKSILGGSTVGSSIDALAGTPVFTFSHEAKLRNEESNFWKKAWHGEAIVGGIELAGMVILIGMPQSVTKWSPNWMQDAKHNFVRAFTKPPVIDHDDWQINYIGHPVAGSYYYNVVRSQNANWWQSLLYSTAQSAIWEYIIEGYAEQPSIQDLIVTPLGGAIIGEPVHLATMSMRRNGFNFFEKVFVILLNPMFAINNGFGPKHNPVRLPN